MAAFFANLVELQKLIVNKTDTQINIEIPKGDYAQFWKNNNVQVDVLDILNWAYYGFYNYAKTDCICHKRYNEENTLLQNDCINLAKHYQNVMECLDWLCTKFSIKNYALVNYSKYRKLRHFIVDNESWLDESECNEAIKMGFNKIDLDLINEAEKGNGIACYNLVKKGANYLTDPIDFTTESAIVSMLDSGIQFNMINLVSYLYNKNNHNKVNEYYMLASLHQVGVGSYILDILTTNETNSNKNCK